MILRDRDADNNGTLEERLYVAQDANWNVTALFNSSGAVVERFRYEAYGKREVLNAAWASLGSDPYAFSMALLAAGMMLHHMEVLGACGRSDIPCPKGLTKSIGSSRKAARFSSGLRPDG